MYRPRLKTFIASFLASVLLYYSAAWAVLRCCHDEDEATREVSLFEAELANQHSHVSLPSHALTQLDCLDFDYHIEFLAGPASPPQFHRLTTAATPYANEFFALKSLADGHGKNLLRIVFTRGSPHSGLFGPPLYLYLSSLRI